LSFKIFLSALFLLSFSAQAFDKDFKTVNDRAPLEFTYLFESMKLMIKTPSEKIRMVGLCQDLDQNLGFLPKEQIFLLMKSEVIKNVMEYKFKNVRQFDVSALLIDRLEKELVTRQKYLTPFSLWIWRSVIAELKARQNQGLITDRSFSVSTFDGEKRKLAERFRRYLDYLLPWIDKMDSLDATQFNLLAKEVSWNILRRMNDRSLLFKRYSSTAVGDSRIVIFNIPERLTNLHPEDIKRMQIDDPSLTLKEQGEKEKTEATSTVESLAPTDMSTISDDISRELEKKTP
jgi:hypothetical protein